MRISLVALSSWLFLAACSSSPIGPGEPLATEVGGNAEDVPATETRSSTATSSTENTSAELVEPEANSESASYFAPVPVYQSPNIRVDDGRRYTVSASIPPDGIRPIYEPRFATMSASPLTASELVIGVAWGGEAKAYPITVLRFREMVNDELAGIPTLVTW